MLDIARSMHPASIASCMLAAHLQHGILCISDAKFSRTAGSCERQSLCLSFPCHPRIGMWLQAKGGGSHVARYSRRTHVSTRVCHEAQSFNLMCGVQVKDDGYEVAHDGYCVTVFSAPNYCDNMANKGAFITFNGDDMVPHFTQFAAVPHPDVKPMAYANSIFNFL